MAEIEEIQVCGGHVHQHLYSVCLDYIACVDGKIDREKINFAVALDDGSVKHITFRETDDGVQVYGDFEGMPNALEWAKRVFGSGDD